MDPRQVRNNKKEEEVKEEDTEMLNDSISSEFDTIKDKTQKTYIYRERAFGPQNQRHQKDIHTKGRVC